jgi:6,7-dimethyl-8-ribityllumazine synthase|tara:strand:- start:8899 stop:9342 length:444 start_codon:yes stop_codon:yes gene_type:complete
MIYVIKSLFNSDITNGLQKGLFRAFEDKGIKDLKMKIIEVPGAYDIPGAVARVLEHNKLKVVITLGCVIKGETDHYHYICDAVANGIMNLTLKSKTPILFGVLTCQNYKLADDRSGHDMNTNKGYQLGLMANNLISEQSVNDHFSKS